jgi:hypothetical protein
MMRVVMKELGILAAVLGLMAVLGGHPAAAQTPVAGADSL